MTSSILLHELTREDAGAVAPETLLVLPVGATSNLGRAFSLLKSPKVLISGI